MKKHLLLCSTFFVVMQISLSGICNAQCMNCGTGSDGAYSATGNQLLPGGTYNYTSFYIAPGVTVLVSGTTPLVINCTGNVNIQGTLSANGGNGGNGITFSTFGVGGIGVAGGANGGNGVYIGSPSPGSPGFGPGAGGPGDGWSGGGGGGYSAIGDSSHGVGGFGGPAYGSNLISPVVGGSGGGGGSGGNSCGSGGGGAGGGIIVISSCGNITIGPAGVVRCNGGNGGSDGTGNCGGGGGGSGGSVLLAADTINNSGTISAIGGTGGASNVPGNPYYGGGANGSSGRVRFDISVYTGAGTVNPAAGFIGQQPLSTSIATQTNLTCNGDSSGTAQVVASGGYPPYSYSWNPSSQNTATATNLSVGTYTVTVTDSIGTACTASVTITQPPPIIISVALGMTVCEGTCDTVFAVPSGGNGPPYTYLWTPGNITTPTVLTCPDSTTNYTCTIWDAVGCSSSATTVVTVAPLPAVTLSAQSDTACLNWTADVLNGTPPGGTFFGIAVTGSVFNPSFAGLGIHNIGYAYTDSLGCTDTAAISIVVDICAGIEPLSAEQLDVFPNPASEKLIIENGKLKIEKVEIYNALGEKVFQLSSSIINYPLSIDVSQLPAGIYFLKTQIEKEIVYKKITIER